MHRHGFQEIARGSTHDSMADFSFGILWGKSDLAGIGLRLQVDEVRSRNLKCVEALVATKA